MVLSYYNATTALGRTVPDGGDGEIVTSAFHMNFQDIVDSKGGQMLLNKINAVFEVPTHNALHLEL